MNAMAISRRSACRLYVAAHFGKSLLWTASDLVTIYALVDLLGVDARSAGWVFMIGLSVNAVTDLLVGMWLDRHPARTGATAAIGLVVSAVAFPATVLAATHGVAAMLVATLVFRIAYSAYDVPHNAMLSRLSDRPEDSLRLSRARTWGTGAAAMLVGLGLYLLPSAEGLSMLLCLLALAGGILGAGLPILAARYRPATRTASPYRGSGLPGWFLLGSVAGIAALAMLAKALFHLPDGIGQTQAGTIVILLTLGRTASALLPVHLGDAARGRMLLAAAYALTVPLVIVMTWRADGVMALLLGFCMGATSLVGWALLPFYADRARSYGLYTMACKIALGVAGLLMTAGMGKDAGFAVAGYRWFVLLVAIGCVGAAVLFCPRRRLTKPFAAMP